VRPSNINRPLLIGAAIGLSVSAACGSASTALADVRNEARPARVSIALVRLDGGPTANLVVRVTAANGRVDSVAVGTDGRATFSVDTSTAREARVDISSTADAYGSSGSLIVQADTALDVALLPRRWEVRRGIYARQVVPIDLLRAVGAADDSVFLNHAGPSQRQLLAWRPDAFPIAVGLDTTLSRRRWTASDSALFWGFVDSFNAIAGQTLFKPGPDHPTGASAVGLRIAYLPATITPRTYLGWDLNRCPATARFCPDLSATVEVAEGLLMSFPDSPFNKYSLISNRKLVQHELMHTLGFGHECFWASVMVYTTAQCTGAVPEQVTENDIAYIELVQALAQVLVTHPAAWHIAEALRAEGK